MWHTESFHCYYPRSFWMSYLQKSVPFLCWSNQLHENQSVLKWTRWLHLKRQSVYSDYLLHLATNQELTDQVQISAESVVHLWSNVLGKDINPSRLSPAIGEIAEQTWFFKLGREPNIGNKQFWEPWSMQQETGNHSRTMIDKWDGI